MKLHEFQLKTSGYGPEKDFILRKTIEARDKHKRVEDCVTEPLITTVSICDLCDNRIEVYDVKQKSCYHLLV